MVCEDLTGNGGMLRDAEGRWRRRDADGGNGGVIAGREEEGFLLLCVKIVILYYCV